MRRMSKFVGLLDKYGNVEEDTQRHLAKIDLRGHVKINGTYSGAAYTTSLANAYMATNLQSESNPKGSILVEAKNYTDSKIKHIHYIKLTSDNAQVYVKYMSTKDDP